MAKAAKHIGPELSAHASQEALAPAWQDQLAHVRSILCKLAINPPQVLLIEGGLEEERLALARFWAALQHCDSQHEELGKAPCGKCQACLHIGADLHMDVLVYDGRISNTEDEENPGPIRALSKDNAVNIKSRVADSTRSGKKRVVIMNGIEMKRNSAANTLLKVLEEPSPTSIFVLLTPQREQLLPTLVSRSWVLTLPWPKTRHITAELSIWEQGLANFLQDGRKWWDLAKGTIDHNLALQIVLLCQKCLLPALAAEKNMGTLSQWFSRLSPKQSLALAQKLDEAQDALFYNVHPARVLDNLATQLYVLCNEDKY